jgi:hypothetical protein
MTETTGWQSLVERLRWPAIRLIRLIDSDPPPIPFAAALRRA